MAELPNDLVAPQGLPTDLAAPPGLPADLVSAGGLGVPTDLVDVAGSKPSVPTEVGPHVPSAEPETNIAEKIALAIQRASNEPVTAFASSVSRILSKSGMMTETNANKLGRDLVAGIESLGPLGMEFAGLAGQTTASGAARKAGRVQATDAATFRPAPSAPMPVQAVEGAARLAGFEGAKMPEAFAGNVNLNRIFAPEDVKQIISETAAQNAEFMGARRGVITQDQTREMSRLAGMTPEALSKRVEGQALNAEEMFAARTILVDQATRVRSLARNAFGGSDLDKASFADEMTRLPAIQEHVSGATAEAGRALQQF